MVLPINMRSAQYVHTGFLCRCGAPARCVPVSCAVPFVKAEYGGVAGTSVVIVPVVMVADWSEACIVVGAQQPPSGSGSARERRCTSQCFGVYACCRVCRMLMVVNLLSFEWN